MINMDRKYFRDIRTDTWHTIEYLGMPAARVSFVYTDREIPEPGEALDIRKRVWREKLEERKSVLEEANPENEYIIRFDEETGEDSLFERGEPDSRKMWAGRTVTMAGYDVTDDRAEILVHPISYTEWIACYDPEYGESFSSKGLPLPYAGIGASVLIETGDGLTPLTRRGIETPVYPARLYSPGGGPKPGEDSTEALIQEILEETGMKEDEHFDPSKMLMMALVADTNFAGSRHSRPELVAYLPTWLSYRDIEYIQYEMIRQKGKKETDVWGIEPVSMNPTSLQQTIKLHGEEMCPPTEAALTYALYGKWKESLGRDEAYNNLREFTESLRKYERREFVPQIRLLADSL